MNPTTSNDTGSTTPDFRYYPVDQAIDIIRAIAEHRWPMTVKEAFSLRDQSAGNPLPTMEDFFVTPVSNGEEDGTISIDRENRVLHIQESTSNLTSPTP